MPWPNRSLRRSSLLTNAPRSASTSPRRSASSMIHLPDSLEPTIARDPMMLDRGPPDSGVSEETVPTTSMIFSSRVMK